MDKVKFGVIGCGNIGKRHLAILDAEQRAKVTAVCDVDESLCKKYSEMYGTIDCFKDYKEMISKSDADVISICTPHALHYEMAMEVAKAGKHILVEKPMALSSQDALSMINTAKQNNVKLMVVKQNRYNIPVLLTKKALDDNKLGQIFMVQCNVLWNREDVYYTSSPWRGKKALEGGALYTQASHFIDLLIWWFGDVIGAQGTIATKNHNIEIEDCGIAQLQFASGVLGSLTWTTCVYNKNYEGSITIIGEKGTIKIGGPYLNKIDFWDIKAYPLTTDIEFSDRPNDYGGRYQGSSSNHDKLITHLIDMLSQGNGSVVEGEEGIKSIAAIEMIYQNCLYSK